MSLHEKVQRFIGEDAASCSALRHSTISKTREAIKVLQETFERYDADSIALSYNGGKDCLVLLVLLVAHLEGRSSNGYTSQRRIQTVYVAIENPFQEVDDFIDASAKDYSLEVVKIQKQMKEAFAEYLDTHPAIRAILVGTRRNDPHGSQLTFFDETDQAWPKFMRIHPIINWTYAEVWDFLRALELPYCPLYDMGYTSLGGKGDTLPNPSLAMISEQTGDEAYKPAWQLPDGNQERLGREKARKTPQAEVTSMNQHPHIDKHHQR